MRYKRKSGKTDKPTNQHPENKSKWKLRDLLFFCFLCFVFYLALAVQYFTGSGVARASAIRILKLLPTTLNKQMSQTDYNRPRAKKLAFFDPILSLRLYHIYYTCKVRRYLVAFQLIIFIFKIGYFHRL